MPSDRGDTLSCRRAEHVETFKHEQALASVFNRLLTMSPPDSGAAAEVFRHRTTQGNRGCDRCGVRRCAVAERRQNTPLVWSETHAETE